jgi:hypothetical protein
MRLPALKHLVEAVQALAHSRKICVLGSSALLVTREDLGDPGQPLELSFDADLLLEPCDEALAAMLHEAVGEGSLFAGRTGYYADILRPEIVETLPAGWPQRSVRLDVAGDVCALSPLDVAAVKLRVGRAKDLDLVRCLHRLGIVTEAGLRDTLRALPLTEAETVRVFQRLAEALR